jgi:hypothetical protein
VWTSLFDALLNATVDPYVFVVLHVVRRDTHAHTFRCIDHRNHILILWRVSFHRFSGGIRSHPASNLSPLSFVFLNPAQCDRCAERLSVRRTAAAIMRARVARALAPSARAQGMFVLYLHIVNETEFVEAGICMVVGNNVFEMCAVFLISGRHSAVSVYICCD